MAPANSRRSCGSGNGAASAACSISSSSRFHFVPDRCDVVVREPVLVAEPGGCDEQRVALSPFVELALRPVLPGIATRMADEAVGRGLDELRPASAPDALDDFERRRLERPRRPSRRRSRLGSPSPPARATIPPGVTASVGVYSPYLLFSQTKTTGRLKHLREVQALEEVRLVRRAVAEIRDSDSAGGAERDRGARGGGDAAADDAVAAQDAVVGVDDVHGACAARR